MSSLKQPLDQATDETMRVWWWLRSNVKDGLLLSLCQAVLETDTDALIAICKAHFLGNWGVAEVCSIGCNRALNELNLTAALRTGFSFQRGGGRDFSSMLLISDTAKSVITVIKHIDDEEPSVTGMVEQKVPLVSFSMLKTRDALINAVEAMLSRC